MSQAEVQDIYETLARIESKLAHIKAEAETAKQLLGDDEGTSATGSSSGGGSGLSKSMRVLQAGMGAIQKFGGNQGLTAIISKMQLAIAVGYELQAVQMAVMASNPYTAGFAIFGLATTAATTIMANTS